jgi:hypothetical protein
VGIWVVVEDIYYFGLSREALYKHFMKESQIRIQDIGFKVLHLCYWLSARHHYHIVDQKID